VTTARLANTLLLAAALGCAGAQKTAPARSASGAPRGASREASDARPESRPDAPPARVQRLFAEALQAQEDQRKLKVPTDWALLERKWRGVVDAGELAEARFNLGVALEAQGRLPDARAEYERARELNPSLRQATVNLGVLLEKEGDVRAAAAVYADIVRDHPEDARSRERLAALYRASGQVDEAWRLAREALLRDPSSVGAYKVLVRVAAQRNNLDLANLIALRAQKLDATDPELPFLTAQVLARQGDEVAATAQYRKALALDERYLPARYALLETAVKKQSWTNVAEQAQAILREDPRNAPVHLALGVAQRHLGKADEALASYARAQELGGDKLAEVHLARGVLYMRVKNTCEPALDEFRAYARAVGPVAATESPVLKLQRECETIVEENRKAVEAARTMQLDSERKAAEDAARKAGHGKPAAPEPGGVGGAAPTSAPNPSR
jgi:Flp pilus assembly protein TadD